MSNYSIELKAREIKNPQTLEYFREVYGCYSQGYYRSAVVMLWSVVVTDLLLKLDDLISSEDGANYQLIKDEIDKIRTNDPKSSNWELTLVKLMAERSELLDNANLTDLEALQKHRHLSAHPVLTNEQVLYEPNQDQARGHIVVALNAVLTKPSLMGRKVLFSFLNSIANFDKNASPENEHLENFILKRYVEKISENAQCKLFVDLWKFVFCKTDKKAEENRVLNAEALIIIYKNRKQVVNRYLDSETPVDLPVESLESEESMKPIFKVLFREPELYEKITEDGKSVIIAYAKKTKLFAISSPFIHSFPAQYFQSIEETESNFSGTLYEGLIICYDSYFDEDDELISFAISHFADSSSFPVADQRWHNLLDKLIDRFKNKHVIEFCEEVMIGRENFGGYIQCLGCSPAIDRICGIILEKGIELPDSCSGFSEQYEKKLSSQEPLDDTPEELEDSEKAHEDCPF